MLRSITLALAVLLLTSACGAPFEALRAGGDLVIRGGTSFGMCHGLCATELRIDGTEAVFVQKSRDPGTRPVTRTLQLDEAEWRALEAAAARAAFEGLQEVYGCPDCADGGAEWVEVSWGGETRRVTFEYGATVERIQPLIDRLRTIRQRFPT